MFEPAEEGGFVVTFPDFDSGIIQGDTEEEATEMAADVLSMVIDHEIQAGGALPQPGRRHRARYRTVRLPALQAAKAEFYRAFLETGIREAERARRPGIAKADVDRLFDLRNYPRLGQIEAALKAVGKEREVMVRDAA